MKHAFAYLYIPKVLFFNRVFALNTIV